MAKEKQQEPKDDEKEALFGHMTEEDRRHAGLTEEEIAGIEGDGEQAEETEEEPKGESEVAEGEEAEAEQEDKSEEDDAEDEAEGEAGDEDEAEEATSDDATGEGEAEAEEEDEDDPLDDTRSIMPSEWRVPADHDEKVAAVDQQSRELAARFDEGEITAADYRKEQQVLDDQRFDLKQQLREAKQSWQRAAQDWANKTVKAFLRENPQYSSNNPTMNKMLDTEVQRLQSETDDIFNPRLLREAHKNITAAFKQAVGQEPAAGTKGGKKTKGAEPPTDVRRPKVPPTLARVPQDAIDDVQGGKFARLERLAQKDPSAYEEAIAKLSPADREAYLAGAA